MQKNGRQEARRVVLVRLETSPEDITGMKASQGILTVRGGMTSHAAVVARGMGTCCVSGCGDIAMDEENKKFTLAGKEYHEGDPISIDGTTGNIYDGIIPTVDATITGEFGRIMAWADKYRRLKFVQMQIHLQMLRKHVSLAQKVSVFAVQSICSLKKTESQHSRDDLCRYSRRKKAALDKILPYPAGRLRKIIRSIGRLPGNNPFLRSASA